MIVSKELFEKVQKQIEDGLKTDIHTGVAAAYYNIPVEAVTREQRAEAKMGNYVWLYSN